MSSLKNAIQRFQETQARVYKAQPHRVLRDGNAARRSTKDYAGRWFFELVQNCEDAHASKVVVKVTDEAIYVADDGEGFRPDGVESISGTDFSEKPVGAIGRKGVGFKAVYEVTSAPQVFTGDAEGLEFDPAQATNWLARKEIDCTEESQPYQWIPFFVDRRRAEEKDEVLHELHDYSTVVKLPLKSKRAKEHACQHLAEWRSSTLLPFQHVKCVKVSGTGVAFGTTVQRDGSIWIISDSRNEESMEWRVLSDRRSPPKSITTDLDPEDQKRVSEIGFLVAAPMKGDGAIDQTSDAVPVHVFYPTEQPAPIRMLLHAEFLVKTDRTRVVPLEESPFNNWVADELAGIVLDFVNDAYDPKEPEKALCLLEPMEGNDQLPLATALWARIRERARNKLRLPSVNGKLNLALHEALVLSVSVARDGARRVLAGTREGRMLVHSSVDSNPSAEKALKELGCDGLRDRDLLALIQRDAAAKAGEREWLWACWQWVAAWLAEKPHGDERKKRKEKIRAMPILPVNDHVRRPAELADQIVTWRTDGQTDELPEWLPLTFVDDWFRNRATALDREDPLRDLLDTVGVERPAEDVLLSAFERAVTQYWLEPSGDPSRFVHLLLQHRWDQQYDPPEGVGDCPVLTEVAGEARQGYAKADGAYFGAEWGEDKLAELYTDVPDVPWVVRPPSGADEYRAVLEWLGVLAWPRVLPSTDEAVTRAENKRVRPLVGRRFSSVSVKKVTPLVLDRVNLSDLRGNRAIALVSLLTENWSRYYERYSQVKVQYTPRSRTYSERVPAHWWYQVRRELCPPVEADYAAPAPLAECWLPDAETKRAIGDLLPVVDTTVFGDEEEAVSEWLRETVRLRRSLDQVSLSEWEELLSERIPQLEPARKASADSDVRDKVARWYEACLRSLDEQEVSENCALAEVPLLARRGTEWDYVKASDTWLADDQQLAEAFRDKIWQVHIRSAYRPAAAHLFGMSGLSKAVNREYRRGFKDDEQQENLSRKLDEVRSYVFAWRYSQTKADASQLREDIASIRTSAVRGLRVCLKLPGLPSKEVVCGWGVEGREVLVNVEDSGARVSQLADALAEALGVKSEADLYDILLRCKSEADRRDKLISKGVTSADLDRLLRLYENEPEPAGEETGPQRETLTKGDEAKDTGTKEPRQNDPSEHVPEQPGEMLGEGSRLNLRNPEQEPILDGDADSGTGGGGGGRTGEGISEGLTEQQKLDIERCARKATMKKLQGLGYMPTEMPPQNPGYDIKAIKEGTELRVEVKGHRGRARVIELTARELREHYDTQQKNASKWELWNVENLSNEVPGQITITRYAHIPEEALYSRALSVDLSKCDAVQE